jgi:hypothetical protein
MLKSGLPGPLFFVVGRQMQNRERSDRVALNNTDSR